MASIEAVCEGEQTHQRLRKWHTARIVIAGWIRLGEKEYMSVCIQIEKIESPRFQFFRGSLNERTLQPPGKVFRPLPPWFSSA